jgi:hypothetical protein
MQRYARSYLDTAGAGKVTQDEFDLNKVSAIYYRAVMRR